MAFLPDERIVIIGTAEFANRLAKRMTSAMHEQGIPLDFVPLTAQNQGQLGPITAYLNKNRNKVRITIVQQRAYANHLHRVIETLKEPTPGPEQAVIVITEVLTGKKDILAEQARRVREWGSSAVVSENDPRLIGAICDALTTITRIFVADRVVPDCQNGRSDYPDSLSSFSMVVGQKLGTAPTRASLGRDARHRNDRSPDFLRSRAERLRGFAHQALAKADEIDRALGEASVLPMADNPKVVVTKKKPASAGLTWSPGGHRLRRHSLTERRVFPVKFADGHALSITGDQVVTLFISLQKAKGNGGYCHTDALKRLLGVDNNQAVTRVADRLRAVLSKQLGPQCRQWVVTIYGEGIRWDGPVPVK